jgi:hypothetical protein
MISTARPVAAALAWVGEALVVLDALQAEGLADRGPAVIIDPDADPAVAAFHLASRDVLIAAAAHGAVVDVLDHVRKAHRRRRFGFVDRHLLSAADARSCKQGCSDADIGAEPRGERSAVAAAVERSRPCAPLLNIMPESAWSTISGPLQSRSGPSGPKALMSR